MAEKLDISWALRQLRNPKATRLANSIETAERLRRSSPQSNYQEEAQLEVNSRGYTAAQCRQGGFRNALASNRKALLNHFTEAVPVLEETQTQGLLKQTALHLTQFGVNWAQLQKILNDSEKARSSRQKAQKAEEAELWAIYCKGGRQALEKATLPA